ncbi:BON domain-containing protein [Leptolyngbya sp. NK1-12]|uniref:BON domain-containing protein n=1 Tax=Leptolyngbya sp. NK1-12 TaxID=2547451 RepID=A0AA96WZ06_9CYAN|nr:BON domain-containing protein [Leptolyngbya sp. NK1-12]MBF2048031.1 BON domain-containing protein [Elainella sp. C42_A2020_010]WNZ27402.1 BON domain-containing protein [Leptolyngbya sp. NK1-12]
MKRLTTALLGGFLLLGAVACTETAQTNTEAPDQPSDTAQAPDAGTAQDTQDDATSEIRRNQLESDIRAREQRNEITGGDADRADGDLESEVRSKLEANLPASQLSVEAEDGAVTVRGTVPTEEQLARIEPLAREIKGVQTVAVEAEVAPAQ